MGWEVEVVERLVGLRAGGVSDFDEAWWVACSGVACRPRSSPSRQLRLGEGEEEVLSFVDWFREACRREWLGLVRVDFSALRDFAGGLDEGGVTAMPAGGGRRGGVVLVG